MTSNPPLPDDARAALAALASTHAPAQGNSATTDAAAQSAKPTAKSTLSSAASDPLPTAVEAPSTPNDESVREARAVAEAAIAQLIAEKDQEIVELEAMHSNTLSGTTSDAAITRTQPSEAQGGVAAAAVDVSSTTPASSVSRANRMYLALAEEDGDTADLAAGLDVARSPRTASSHAASSHVVHRVWSPPHSPNHDRGIKAAPELLHPVGSVANSRKLFERCVCAFD